MKRTRKIFALLLSICMIVTMLPTVAFAEDLSTADAKLKAIQLKDQTVVLGQEIEGKENEAKTVLSSSNVMTIKMPYAIASGKGANTFTKFGTGDYKDEADTGTAKIAKDDALSFAETEQDIYKAWNEGTALNETAQLASVPAKEEKSVWIVIQVENESTYNYYVVKVDIAAASDDALIKNTKVKDTADAVANVTDPDHISAGSDSPVILTAEKVAYGTLGKMTKVELDVQENATVKYVNDTSLESPTWRTDNLSYGEPSEQKKTVTITELSFEQEKALYIEVTAEDGTLSYYKLTLEEDSAKTDNSIYAITVGGEGVMSLKEGTAFSPAMDAITFELPYDMEDQSEKPDIVVTVDKDAELKYATDPKVLTDVNGDAGKGTENKTDKEKLDYTLQTKVTVTPTEADDIYFKVTAQNGTSTYYKLTITMKEASKNANIKEIKIGGYKAESADPLGEGTQESPETYTISVPDGTLTDKTPVEVTVAEPVKSVGVQASADGKSLTYTTALDPDKAKLVFNKSEVDLQTGDLYLKVTADDDETEKYYKVIFTKLEFKVEDPTTETDGVNVAETEQDVVEASVKGVKVDKDAMNSKMLEDMKADGGLKTYQVQDEDNKVKALLQKNKETNDPIEGNIQYVAVAYLDIQVDKNGYKANDEGTYDKYTLDITPRYYVAGTTQSDPEQRVFKGDDAAATPSAINSVKLSTPEENGKDPILDLHNVDVTIKLPTGFGTKEKTAEYGSVSPADAYVKIEGGNAKKTSFSEGRATINFLHFCEVEVLLNPNGVAMIDDVVYKTLKEAIDKVEDDQTITLLDSITSEELGGIQAPNNGVKNFKVDTSKLDKDKKVEEMSFASSLSVDGKTTYNAKATPDKDFESNNIFNVEVSDEPTPEEVIPTPPDDEPGSGEGGTNDKHSVKVADGITNGTVIVDKMENVAKDETVTVTVKPAEGYELDKLTITRDSGAVPRD